MKSAIRRLTTLTALTAATLVGSAIASTSALAQNYGQQPIAPERAVAIAEPVSNGRFFRLLILEQLSDQRACFAERAGSPTVIEPLLLNFDFSGICGRRSDSNGYSVNIGNEDLSRRYRLQLTRQGDSLVLIALPGALPGQGGDLPTLEIGRSNGVANDFVKITLDPGWQLSRRTLNGSAQGHVYLSNSQSLETVIAQAGGPRPAAPAPTAPAAPTPAVPAPAAPTPVRPPILSGGSLPAPGASPVRPSSPASGETFYQVIVPSSSIIVRSRVRQIAPDAFNATVDGRQVIQAGLFQEQTRADQLVAQLSGQGIESQIIEGRRAALPGQPASSDTYYQVVVPESGADTRDRVNTIEAGAFRTQVNGRPFIQAGRFRERDRAEQLQQRLSAARLPAQIIEGSAPVASVPRPAPAPSVPSPAVPAPSVPAPSVPRPRQGQLTVVLDAGHGGRDPGAIGIGGLREKDINLDISRRVQQILNDRGINTVMARADDRELDLQPRVDIAERANADIFVSIHANAISLSRPEVNGLETYYHSSGLRLAQTIHNSLLQRTDLNDRGVRRARFYVLVNTSMPAVLVETGFVTGREDAARFRDPQAVGRIAEGIANGILQYLNVQ
ncbi:MAG: N-acetylmuramoyl-L-alanine amidase [Phormidesmis sp.]